MAHNLDLIDLEILRFLQKDAKITNKELGANLNRSASVIFERIKELERQGFIISYKAILDYSRISNLFISYTAVRLNDHSGKALDDFEIEICKHEEVVECIHITGSFDFILKVVVTNMHTYTEFLRSKLSSMANVGKIYSNTVISEKKRLTEYPIK